MENNGFLGTGVKFPPQVDQSTGRFMLSAGADSVKESVYLILMTQRGERWLEPGFGSGLMGYTFMDTSITMLSIMANDIRSVIIEQEPRISDVHVDVEPNDKNGSLLVNIQYEISGTNTRDNMVFPFYLNAVDEEKIDGSAE
jgi:phage baseplate assembly protein W